MELIQKKINVNTIMNRYGEIPVLGNDVVCENDNLFGTRVPVLEWPPRIAREIDTDPEYYYVRFGTLSNYVSWLRKFFKEAVVWQYCKRYNDFYWKNFGKIVDLDNNSCEISYESALDETEITNRRPNEGEVGEFVIVSAYADEFNDIFGSLSAAKQFYEYACGILKENSGTKEQRIDINLFIGEKYEDLGRFTEYTEEDAGFDDSRIDEETAENGELESGITAYTSSYIGLLARKKKTYDINGNELPFILENETSTTCELPYYVGLPCNMRFDSNGNCYYDLVTDIHFEDEDGEEGEHVENGAVTVDNADIEPIIVFTYELGRSISEDETETTQGVVHVEKYRYEIIDDHFNVDGKRFRDYSYIKVDYGAVINEEWLDVSAIDMDGIERSDPYFKTHFVFNEALLGVHNYSESTDGVWIERGTSAAFEPHNLLGQMSSIEEIERYKGDLFKIGKENS